MQINFCLKEAKLLSLSFQWRGSFRKMKSSNELSNFPAATKRRLYLSKTSWKLYNTLNMHNVSLSLVSSLSYTTKIFVFVLKRLMDSLKGEQQVLESFVSFRLNSVAHLNLSSFRRGKCKQFQEWRRKEKELGKSQSEFRVRNETLLKIKSFFSTTKSSHLSRFSKKFESRGSKQNRRVKRGSKKHAWHSMCMYKKCFICCWLLYSRRTHSATKRPATFSSKSSKTFLCNVKRSI